MSPSPRELSRGLLEALFPPQCAACGALGREPFCRLCWESVSPASYQELPGLEMVASLWDYGGAVAVAIQRLKYQGRYELGRSLGEALRPLLPGFGRLDRLLPVPLTRRRLFQRGYNQARELARPLPLTVDPRSLRRTREAPPQASLDREERLNNMQGAFQCDPEAVRGQRLLILDDVLTTGATAMAAAEALRAAGAAQVSLLTLARTPA